MALEQFDPANLPATWATIGLIFAFRIIHSVWRAIQFRRTYREFLNLPNIGDASQTDLRSAMEEGTRKYPNRPFILPLQNPTVILPHNVIDEIKSLPQTSVSIEANNYRRFFGRYTLMGTKSDEFVAAIKQDLTRNVDILLPEMQEETEYAASATIGDQDGSSFPVYPTMLRFIALLSGRAFVGLPLSRSEEWIQSSINYAIESVAAGQELRTYPAQIRTLVAPFLKKIQRVQQHQARVREMLHETIASCHHTAQRSKSPLQDPNRERARLASWLLRHYSSQYPVSEEVLGKDHLLAFFAAIHIATNALTQTLLDLAARPEYQDGIRDEINTVLGSTPDRKLSLAGLGKMAKLDSFMKESLRVNPPGGIVTLMRETTAPLLPSCGPLIPKGTLIAFANNRFDMSSPQQFGPDDFDGFRYARLRETAGNESSHQFITPSSDSLTWGYGSHACPGRLFAATELKVIVIHLLSQFDLQLKDGESRPANSSHDFQIMPDPRAEIIFSRTKMD
ncbi:hypothetical protein AJ80_05567 [Polytolypa hystricis UAMH7299]|uniref:Cytochrome P450 monooxygenase n=1 Tax=Polytolypa hystricis (strain UAMH7299) TaxID=1447883 RepID=A0A2B7Y2X6_POLH7|nr:hypothetical protein AJ80_05567 [Polytolypa hystricis UAMH7299]